MNAALSAADPSPFHHGERAVQERVGVRDIERWARKVVRPYMPEQHRAFYTRLPFLVAAVRDADDRPWVTILAGAEGATSSPDEGTLRIGARPVPGDATEHAFVPGTDLGLLGIEFSTRRRNRVNGRVGEGEDAIVLSVDQSFGNCPQYIHERDWRRVEVGDVAPARRTTGLDPRQRAWVEAADTLFIASGYRGEGESPTFGMDASHRGGEPGFVEVDGQGRLTFPDHAGNNYFNTIGNLVVDPRVGLTFVDFARGSLLQLTGRATIVWEGEEVERRPGARRLVVIAIDEVVQVDEALPLRWDGEAGAVRSLRLVDKIPESDDVTSFVFESRDGGDLVDFEAGQHLPLVVPVEGMAPATRTYSLSNGPGEGRYRISVKREPQGLVSRFLHDQIEPGAIVASRAPAGDFVLPHGGRPVVMISAGVGVTPMVSMLRALVTGGADRQVWFVHGARDGAHHVLGAEVEALVAEHPKAELHVVYSRPREGDTGHHAVGRIDGDRVADLVGEVDADYMLCGPVAFMASVTAGLEERGVARDRIHFESFGPR